jgi:secondary thiamine-phosphate synthase enzyme
MMYREVLEFEMKKGVSVLDITKEIETAVKDSKIQEGLCHVFIKGTTGAIMMNENDPMLLEDFKRMFERMIENKLYLHPSNAFSHLRASLIKTSETVPVSGNKLILGDWQSILLWEFDVRPRKRKVIVTVSGE